MTDWADRIARVHLWMHIHRKGLLYAFAVLVLATAALDKSRLVIVEAAIFLNICIWYFGTAEDLYPGGETPQNN